MSWKELVQTLHFIDSTNSKYSRGGGEEYISEGRRYNPKGIYSRLGDIFQKSGGYIPEGRDIFQKRIYSRGGVDIFQGLHYQNSRNSRKLGHFATLSYSGHIRDHNVKKG